MGSTDESLITQHTAQVFLECLTTCLGNYTYLQTLLPEDIIPGVPTQSLHVPGISQMPTEHITF